MSEHDCLRDIFSLGVQNLFITILSIKDDIVFRRQEAKSGHSSLSQITQKQYCMFSTRPRSIKKQNQRKMSLRPYKPYHTFSMRVRSGQVSSSASPPPQLAARHSGVSKGWQDRACSTLGKLKSETRTFLESYFNKQSGCAHLPLEDTLSR